MGRIRVALDTLGCKLNQAETEFLGRQLVGSGYRLVSSDDETDIYILNSCTVTHIADRKSRHLLRMAHAWNPAAFIIATGCYAQRLPQELSRIAGVNLVLSNEQKLFIPRLLEERGYSNEPVAACESLSHDGLRTRAFIKVQDGCSNFCTYCIVPLVRGGEKSIPPVQVIDQIRQRTVDGNKEVVLTGTEIGAYNHDGIRLKHLLRQALAKTEVVRLRLSSLQPQEISSELIELWRDQRLCRHFHLSLQSGSDSVLARMKRRYSAGNYQQTVALIRNMLPEVAITTDIIVGFPGETEAEFEESFSFCQRMEFARIHVFPYSPRERTLAARLPEQVAEKVKKQRSQRMMALAEESSENFRQQFIGRNIIVLWEKQSGGLWSGHTDNYIKVYARNSEDLTNKIKEARAVKLWKDGVCGEL